MPGAYDQKSIQAHFTQTNARLRAIESTLADICSKLDIPYEAPTAEVPDEVVKLAESGDTLGAMKKYRELTGADGDRAMEVVQGL